MLNTQRKVLTTLAGATALGLVSLASSSVNALTLTGGFGFSGTANLNPGGGATGNVTANFSQRFFDQGSGSFADVNPPALSDPGNSFGFVPNPVTFTFDQSLGPGVAFYDSEEMDIEFGSQTISGVTSNLTVTLATNQFLRSFDASSSSFSNVGQISATASFDGMETQLTGSLSVNDTVSSDGTFSLSFTTVAVPEPSSSFSLLLIGCLGGGLMVKRALFRKG